MVRRRPLLPVGLGLVLHSIAGAAGATSSSNFLEGGSFLHCTETTGTCGDEPWCIPPLSKKESTSDSRGVSQIFITPPHCERYSERIRHSFPGIELGCAYYYGGRNTLHQPRDTCGAYQSEGDWVYALQKAANAYLLPQFGLRIDLVYYCYSYYCYDYCDRKSRTECCCSCEYYKHTYIRMHNCTANLPYLEQWILSLPDPPPTAMPTIVPTSFAPSEASSSSSLEPTDVPTRTTMVSFQPTTTNAPTKAFLLSTTATPSSRTTEGDDIIESIGNQGGDTSVFTNLFTNNTSEEDEEDDSLEQAQETIEDQVEESSKPGEGGDASTTVLLHDEGETAELAATEPEDVLDQQSAEEKPTDSTTINNTISVDSWNMTLNHQPLHPEESNNTTEESTDTTLFPIWPRSTSLPTFSSMATKPIMFHYFVVDTVLIAALCCC